MTPPKPYQLEAVREIYHFRGCALLADEMGLGKTFQALLWLTKIPKRRPVIIVTPASVKYNWQAEAALHFDMRVEVLEGRRPKRQMQLPGQVVVLNYDILHDWLPALLRAKPQCVIFDEIHFLMNIKSRRTRAAMRLAMGVPSRIGISGTPILNRPIEFWPILSIIKPDLFPERLTYAWRYCKPKWTPWGGWTFKGASHTGELHRILESKCMIRRLKSEVEKELPDMVHRPTRFRLKSYEEYHEACNDFIGWLHRISPARAIRAKRSKALAQVGYLLRLVAKLKLKQTRQWVADFLESHPDQKLVAFTMNRFVIDYLHEAFPDSLVIDGRVKGRKRQETVHLFQSSPRRRLLFGNWKAAGVGITLTAAANAVGLDFPWTPGDLMQGRDRIHRIGQKHRCVFHYLIAMNTVEETQLDLIMDKAEVLGSVLDGRRSVGDLDILKRLIESLDEDR